MLLTLPLFFSFKYQFLRRLTQCNDEKSPCVAWHVKMVLGELLPRSVRHVIAMDMDMLVRPGADLGERLG